MSKYELAQEELQNLEKELQNVPEQIELAKQAEDFERLAYLHERKGKLPSLIFSARIKASKMEISQLQDEVKDLREELSEATETQKKRDSEIGYQLQSIRSLEFSLKSESMALLVTPLRLKDEIARKENLIFDLKKRLSEFV